MNKVIALGEFEKKAGRLCRKYRTLLNDIELLIEALESNFDYGVPLGSGLRKIRLGTASKGGGKSGGFRVVTYFVEQTKDGNVVYLVTIFDKSEQSNITKKELLTLLKDELL